MARQQVLQSILLLCFLSGPLTPAIRAADFQPDPKSVQRYGPAYRYPQAGWIVLHIEGEPYERGYQHGRLLAPEIADYLRCSAALQSPTSPADGWKNTRSLVNALFLRRYEKEYLEEMKGIADGATAAGARFHDRPIDLVDIVGLNVWPEIETLDSALEATPTGLEGIRFRHAQPRAMPAPKPMHCSAFTATGPATADGKVVFGHITMFSLYPSLFYNIWIDVKPAKGHRVIMQSYPAGIQSGFDYYMNDAGILVSETTIAQTKFDIKGMSVASRIRKALQYADSIDQVVAILKEGNNGLYTNEWLLADTKTNEIAMFELGTDKSKLYRSSKNEWFGGTEGFYWGCNNTKDLQVRLETIPGVNDRPANMVWRPSDRDKKWLQLYHEHKGRMDVAFGKLAFTTPPLAAYHSVDAKFTTTDMAKELKSWAIFGPPLGRSWQPTRDEWKRFPDVRPMASNPWTILHAQEPPKPPGKALIAVDLPNHFESEKEAAAKREEEKPIVTVPAWHGTILPKTDADIWLAAAFADYERIVALEKALAERHGGKLTAADRERLGVQRYGYRSSYLAGARAFKDVPLAEISSAFNHDDWYRIASGKGVLLLHQLREKYLGHDIFDDVMDSFGKANAGKEVTAAQFQEHVVAEAAKHQPVPNERAALNKFFAYWLNQSGLPKLRLSAAKVTADNGEFLVRGTLEQEGEPLGLRVELTIQTAQGEADYGVFLTGEQTTFSIRTRELNDRPLRLIVDKYGNTPKASGGTFSVLSFYHELEKTLIVYGSQDEVAGNKEAAETLQRAIRERRSNFTVPIKSDNEVSDEDLKSHHLLLIGRPDSNRLVERFRSRLPIAFGSRSFTVRNDDYAHAGSAVIAAAENPLHRRFSIVVIAGLSAESTLAASRRFLERGDAEGKNLVRGEVWLLPHGDKPKAFVIPPRELVRDLTETVGKK